MGKGGSGKSTATLCCLNSPLLDAADDYGLVSSDPQPYFHSLYNSGKVNLHDMERFRWLGGAGHCGVLDSHKALYFLHRLFPEKISAGFPLRAIVLPRVSGTAESRITPASRAQAMLALAPSTLFQLPGAEAQKFAHLSALVKALPAYVLESGTDWAQIPRALAELVNTLNASAGHSVNPSKE